jgi:hypothetical protein
MEMPASTSIIDNPIPNIPMLLVILNAENGFFKCLKVCKVG